MLLVVLVAHAGEPLRFDAVVVTTPPPKPTVEIVLPRQEVMTHYNEALKAEVDARLLQGEPRAAPAAKAWGLAGSGVICAW